MFTEAQGAAMVSMKSTGQCEEADVVDVAELVVTFNLL